MMLPQRPRRLSSSAAKSRINQASIASDLALIPRLLRKAMTSLGWTRIKAMPRSRSAAISRRSWPPVGSNATSEATRSSQAPIAAASIVDPLDPSTAGAGIEPPLSNIDLDNQLVCHLVSPENQSLVGTPDCMRARALSTVRVSSRDAGGSEMATVAKDLSTPGVPAGIPHLVEGRQQCNPRLSCEAGKTWMPGTRPGKTTLLRITRRKESCFGCAKLSPDSPARRGRRGTKPSGLGGVR